MWAGKFFQVFILKFERNSASVLSFIYLVIPSASGPRSAPWDLQDPFLANFQQKLWKAWKRETQLQLHHGSKLFGSHGKVSKDFDTCSGKSLCVAASQWSPSLANAAVKLQADRKWKPPLLFQPVGELWSSRLFAPVCRSFVLKHAEKVALCDVTQSQSSCGGSLLPLSLIGCDRTLTTSCCRVLHVEMFVSSSTVNSAETRSGMFYSQDAALRYLHKSLKPPTVTDLS